MRKIMSAVSHRAAQLKLSIEIGSEPISGSVTVGAGTPQQFSGWIELVAAIESARHSGAAEGGALRRGASGGQV